MRAKQFLPEESLGTTPKRPARKGSRPSRGHEAQPRYKNSPGISKDQETKFHAKLDTLVHDTFGKRDDELKEYGDTKNGQKMLTKVQKRAVDRMIKADDKRDAAGAKKNQQTANRAWDRMTDKDLEEGKTQKQEQPKPRNFVAKNMGAATGGAGAHKDKKKASKQGDVKHKKRDVDLAEMESALAEEKASRQLCKSSKPDEDLGASQLASCKSQGLRARDGNKSHKLGKDKKSRVKVGGHRIKGQKYGGPLPDWS